MTRLAENAVRAGLPLTGSGSQQSGSVVTGAARWLTKIAPGKVPSLSCVSAAVNGSASAQPGDVIGSPEVLGEGIQDVRKGDCGDAKRHAGHHGRSPAAAMDDTAMGRRRSFQEAVTNRVNGLAVVWGIKTLKQLKNTDKVRSLAF